MKPFLTLTLLLVAVFARGQPVPDDAHEETAFLFENRKLSVRVPRLFTYDAVRGDVGVVMIRLADPKEKVTLDVRFLPDPEGRFMNARARKEQMVELFESYVESSTEKGMQFEELEPRTGAGTYCVFTDAALVGKTSLPPNEYLHLTAGVKTWPGVIAIFRIFSNDTQSKEYQTVMKTVRESVEEKVVPLK
jgi:hypothetical protein